MGIQDKDPVSTSNSTGFVRQAMPLVSTDFRRLPPHLLSAWRRGTSTGIFTFRLQ